MTTDSLGNPVSYRDQAAIAGLEAAVVKLHGYQADPIADIDAVLNESITNPQALGARVELESIQIVDELVARRSQPSASDEIVPAGADRKLPFDVDRLEGVLDEDEVAAESIVISLQLDRGFRRKGARPAAEQVEATVPVAFDQLCLVAEQVSLDRQMIPL